WAASISWPPATISFTTRQRKTSTPCAKPSAASTACSAQNNPGAARGGGAGSVLHQATARRIDWGAAAQSLPLHWEIRRGKIIKYAAPRSAVIAQEEERQRAGAGVGADHRPDIVDCDLRHVVLLLQQLRQVFRVLQAVAVADE